MVKTACFDDNGMKKGAWSEEEDNKLRAYVQRYGHWNWRLLPKYAGLARCGKSCRLRWVNYLKPGVKKGNFSKQEVDLIVQLHEELGNKWSAIAEKLPGRTDNDIKNYWHAHIKRRNTEKATKLSKQRCSTSHGNQDSMDSLQVKTPSTDLATSGEVAYDHNVSKSWDFAYQNQLGFWNDPLSSQCSINDLCVTSLSAEEDIFSSQLHYTELSTPISSSFSNAFEWISGCDQIITPKSDPQTSYVQESLWNDEPFLSNSNNISHEISHSTNLQAEEQSFGDPFVQVFGKGDELAIVE